MNIEIVPAVNEAKQDYAENEILFENIKPKIISQLKIAKYTIWIAVAWFTDIDIYNELIEKKAQGVNIRIITSDELSNRRLLEKLNKFDLVKIPIQGSNRLHNKFCIIDLEYVMHGSYNWSKNAINNKETWQIFKSREMAEEFSNQFLKLYTEYKDTDHKDIAHKDAVYAKYNFLDFKDTTQHKNNELNFWNV
ncbi:hypothetical protein AN640_07710 [Candidatus Epulonipiscium fishelsonii]|uniref:Uncharacterized protein n=1 Tax=Candidatus Epulonipiscium fishelsonii TaxID=77094 RepID=A0ACC8XF23_9FIRM|nr:hypothetical protein AN640_07710 [Epulopiscium sp. SCG-D08WGA-EpuloA1]